MFVCYRIRDHRLEDVRADYRRNWRPNRDRYDGVYVLDGLVNWKIKYCDETRPLLFYVSRFALQQNFIIRHRKLIF